MERRTQATSWTGCDCCFGFRTAKRVLQCDPLCGFEWTSLCPPQEKRSAKKKNQVRKLDAESRRHSSLSSEREADERSRVVEEDQSDGEHEAGRFPSLFRGQSEGDAHQSKHNTGRR